MKTIWKYDIITSGSPFSRLMPKGAEILTLQMQYTGMAHEQPFLWAIIDPDAEKELRSFVICATGNPFSLTDYKYIGTIQEMKGVLVWHLFEIPNP